MARAISARQGQPQGSQVVGGPRRWPRPGRRPPRQPHRAPRRPRGQPGGIRTGSQRCGGTVDADEDHHPAVGPQSKGPRLAETSLWRLPLPQRQRRQKRREIRPLVPRQPPRTHIEQASERAPLTRKPAAERIANPAPANADRQPQWLAGTAAPWPGSAGRSPRPSRTPAGRPVVARAGKPARRQVINKLLVGRAAITFPVGNRLSLRPIGLPRFTEILDCFPPGRPGAGRRDTDRSVVTASHCHRAPPA